MPGKGRFAVPWSAISAIMASSVVQPQAAAAGAVLEAVRPDLVHRENQVRDAVGCRAAVAATSATRWRRSGSFVDGEGQLRGGRPELGRGRRRVLDERLGGAGGTSPLATRPAAVASRGWVASMRARSRPSARYGHRTVIEPHDRDVERDVEPGPVVLAAAGQALKVLADDGGPGRSPSTWWLSRAYRVATVNGGTRWTTAGSGNSTLGSVAQGPPDSARWSSSSTAMTGEPARARAECAVPAVPRARPARSTGPPRGAHPPGRWLCSRHPATHVTGRARAEIAICSAPSRCGAAPHDSALRSRRFGWSSVARSSAGTEG